MLTVKKFGVGFFVVVFFFAVFDWKKKKLRNNESKVSSLQFWFT